MKRGFTLLEIMIVIGIMAIISAIILFSFGKLNSDQALDKDVLSVISLLNDARSLTLSSKGGTQYGVHVEGDRVVLYKGATYSPSDPENVVQGLNSMVHISSYVLAGGASDILFKRLTGNTEQSGTLTLSIRNDPSVQKNITIFETGIVESD